MEPGKINLLNSSLDELEKWMEDHGAERYRGRQVWKWLYQKGAVSFEEMTDLPASLREKLAGHFCIRLPQLLKKTEAADRAAKFLFELEDRQKIEAVLISEPEKNENTLCLSVQAGCRYGCAFCATGSIGFHRDLKSGEILGQFLAVKKNYPPDFKIQRLVVMGMGEALDNFEELKTAFLVFSSRQGLGISPRRVTISTAGIAPLVAETWELGANLAVSLNCADNEKRTRLMPINKKHPLPELVSALRKLDTRTRQKLTAEYVMLKGVNDSLSDADRLVRLLSGIEIMINLIRFNPFPGSDFSPSDEPRLLAFQDRLKNAGFMTFIRKSKGREILAACGQLAGRK
jgi:23S rRNA (adenine2503-C2)-methyltransferase